MKYQFFYFLFSFLFLSSCTVKGQSVTTVSADEFQKELASAKDFQLLDVRTAGEFETGYIKDALWADWFSPDEYKRRTEALDKNKVTFVYCLSGGRSSKAAKDLASRGFTNVIELQGGINAWNGAGKPLVIEKEVPQISEETFQGMLSSREVVLVDFGAEWCAPCKKMNPIIKEIEKEHANKMTLINIDAGAQKNLAKNHKAEPLPTFILYKNGKEVWRTSGLTEKTEIEKALKAAY